MHYDLGDCTLWEFMFPSNEKPQLTIPDEDDMLDGFDDEDVGISVSMSSLTSTRR